MLSGYDLLYQSQQNRLEQIIDLEIDDQYANLPRFISAPTLNTGNALEERRLSTGRPQLKQRERPISDELPKRKRSLRIFSLSKSRLSRDSTHNIIEL